MVKKHPYNVSVPRLVYFLQSFLFIVSIIKEKIFNKRRGFSGKKVTKNPKNGLKSPGCNWLIISG